MEELLEKALKLISEKVDSKSVIYLTQYGSHLYGLDTESSDYDFRGVFLPNIDDLILGRSKDEVNVKTTFDGKELDIKVFSIQKFFKLCAKGDTNALDLLFSMDSQHQYKYTYSMVGLEFIRETRNNLDKLIDTGKLKSPITYAYKQAERYSLKTNHIRLYDLLIELSDRLIIDTVGELIPYVEGVFDKNLYLTKNEVGHGFLYVLGNEYDVNLKVSLFKEFMESKRDKYSLRSVESCGNDWKALSHAIRILVEVKELLTEQKITFPLKNVDFIKDIKLGKIGRKFIDVYFERELADILDLVRENKLEWKYEEEYWNNLILKWIKPASGSVLY